MRKQLLVESIRVDGQTQSREKISEQTVIEYAEAMKADTGAPFPALSVFFDGTDYWLADGFHRLLAAQRIGRKNIAADVKDGTRKDAAWASCAANQLHGLRRTNPDKRKCVTIALKLHPEMSDRAISNHCGVERELAFLVRRQGVGIPHPVARVGVDGKSYRLPLPKPQPIAPQGHGTGNVTSWPPPHCFRILNDVPGHIHRMRRLVCRLTLDQLGQICPSCSSCHVVLCRQHSLPRLLRKHGPQFDSPSRAL